MPARPGPCCQIIHHPGLSAIPASTPVIPASTPVIPAQAGTSPPGKDGSPAKPPEKKRYLQGKAHPAVGKAIRNAVRSTAAERTFAGLVAVAVGVLLPLGCDAWPRVYEDRVLLGCAEIPDIGSPEGQEAGRAGEVL